MATKKKTAGKTIALIINDAGENETGYGGSRFKISLILPDGSNLSFMRDHVVDVRKVVRQEVTKAFRKPRKFRQDDDE